MPLIPPTGFLIIGCIFQNNNTSIDIPTTILIAGIIHPVLKPSVKHIITHATVTIHMNTHSTVHQVSAVDVFSLFDLRSCISLHNTLLASESTPEAAVSSSNVFSATSRNFSLYAWNCSNGLKISSVIVYSDAEKLKKLLRARCFVSADVLNGIRVV